MIPKGPIANIGANVKNNILIIFFPKIVVRGAHEPQLAVLDHVPVFIVERSHA